MNEKWRQVIEAKLMLAEREGLIDEEGITAYMNALDLGVAQESTRSFSIGLPFPDYLYDRAFLTEGEEENIEGYSDIERNVVSRGILTKEDFYKGFAVQVMQAAKNGEVILFPQDLDMTSQAVIDLEKSERATKAEEVNEDYRRIMLERMKRAFYTYDWKTLSDKYGMSNAGKPTSAINQNSTTRKYIDQIDLIGETPEQKKYKAQKNYANNFVQFLDKGIDEKPVTIYQTGDVAFKYNKTKEGTDALLESFGLSRFESSPEIKVGQKISDIYRKQGSMDIYRMKQHLDETFGEEKLRKANIQFYSNDMLNKALEYGERNFSGYSAGNRKVIGVNVIPIKTSSSEGLSE